MGDHAITNELISPTVNDVHGGVAGDGVNTLEKYAAPWRQGVERAYIVSGFVIPVSSGALDLSIPLGKALIAGYYVSVPGPTTVTCAASATNHVFLKLLRDGFNHVSEAKFEVNTTGTAPADSVKIGTATTSGSAVTSTSDQRLQRPFRAFSEFQVFTAAGTFNVPSTVREIYVQVYGASGGGAGGGGGGGTTVNGRGSGGAKGGEGAAGTYAADVFLVAPGDAHAVTIGGAGTSGGGGAGGTIGGGNGSAGGTGGTGGTTSLGALISVTGSTGGVGGPGGTGQFEGRDSARWNAGARGALGTSGASINVPGGGSPGGPGGNGGQGGQASCCQQATGNQGDGGSPGVAGRIVVWY